MRCRTRSGRCLTPRSPQHEFGVVGMRGPAAEDSAPERTRGPRGAAPRKAGRIDRGRALHAREPRDAVRPLPRPRIRQRTHVPRGESHQRQLQRRACLRDHRFLRQPNRPITVSADRTLRGGKRQEQDLATGGDVYMALTEAGYEAVEPRPYASIRDWLELLLSFLGGASVTVALRLGQQVADDTVDRISEVVVGRVERRLRLRATKGQESNRCHIWAQWRGITTARGTRATDVT